LDGVFAIDGQACLLTLQHLLADFVQALGRATNSGSRTNSSEELGTGTQEDPCPSNGVSYSSERRLPDRGTQCVGEVHSSFAASRDFFLLALHVGTEQHRRFDETRSYTETSQSPAGASCQTTSNSTCCATSKADTELRNLFTGKLASVAEPCANRREETLGSRYILAGRRRGLQHAQLKLALRRRFFHTPTVFGDAGQAYLLANGLDRGAKDRLRTGFAALKPTPDGGAIVWFSKRLTHCGFIALDKTTFTLFHTGTDACLLGGCRGVTLDLNVVSATAKPPRNLDDAHGRNSSVARSIRKATLWH
jgi:hypothetical protein